MVDYLKQFGSAARKKLLDLLAPHLSNALNDQQKNDFVKNLLQEMRRKGTIRKVQNAATKGAAWELSKPATGVGGLDVI